MKSADSMTTLYLSLDLYEAICRHAADSPTVEVCGLIGGYWKPFDRAAIGERVEVIPNAAAQPAVTFLMEARAQIQAMTGFQKAGLETIAIFHSHPQGMDRPSETDIRDCAYPDVVYLIVCPAVYIEWNAENPPIIFGTAVKAWRIRNGVESAVRLEVTE